MSFFELPYELEIAAEANALLQGRTCVFCQELLVWREQDGQPGTVYSEAGLREVRITSSCETCFDNITMPPDEDEDNYTGPTFTEYED